MIDLSVITGLFNKIYQSIINFLPGSPFQALIPAFSLPYLSYLNWFLPITEMLAVFEAYLAVLAVLYLYKALMKFIKIL